MWCLIINEINNLVGTRIIRSSSSLYTTKVQKDKL